MQVSVEAVYLLIQSRSGVHVLCSRTRQFALTQPPPTQVYK